MVAAGARGLDLEAAGQRARERHPARRPATRASPRRAGLRGPLRRQLYIAQQRGEMCRVAAVNSARQRPRRGAFALRRDPVQRSGGGFQRKRDAVIAPRDRCLQRAQAACRRSAARRRSPPAPPFDRQQCAGRGEHLRRALPDRAASSRELRFASRDGARSSPEMPCTSKCARGHAGEHLATNLESRGRFDQKFAHAIARDRELGARPARRARAPCRRAPAGGSRRHRDCSPASSCHSPSPGVRCAEPVQANWPSHALRGFRLA